MGGEGGKGGGQGRSWSWGGQPDPAERQHQGSRVGAAARRKGRVSRGTKAEVQTTMGSRRDQPEGLLVHTWT